MIKVLDSYPPRRTRVQLPIPLQKVSFGTFFYFMIFTVYILYSDVYDKHYTGFTNDLEMRLKSHNEFGKGWTSKYRPWHLIFRKEFDTKTSAREYEKWLKTGVGRDFIKTLNHDPNSELIITDD